MTEEGQAATAGGAGLTAEEAARRLAARGELPPPPSSRSVASIVRANTLTLFNLILGVFLLLILISGQYADGLFAGVLIANTSIGIVQELRAKRALDRAALLVAPRARAVRDGVETAVAVDEVVEGDLVALRPGDQVIADGRVEGSLGLMMDESPLTGESVPVERGDGERVLSGSFCVEGVGGYVVEHAGPESYATRLLGAAREFTAQRSPLELQINTLLRLMVAVMVPLAGALVWALQRHDIGFRQSVATATAGIVTLIPEGLVLLTSLTFAVAAVRLSRRGMLVQYMNAIESLANVDTVCLDKTGTLTDGNLSLHSVAAIGNADLGSSRSKLADYAAAASSRNATLDAVAAGLVAEPSQPQAEVPFSSRWKWSAVQMDGQWLVLGAPDVLLADTLADVSAHEMEGRRVLVFGVARSDIDAGSDQRPAPDIDPLAIVVLEERLREDALETVEFLRRQGVAVKVMSGDSATTVAAVATRAGIEPGDRAWEGDDLPEDAQALAAAAREGTVFARLTPEHKRSLITALTADGAYVAMIGDGINDVPAMKTARLAVALGGGSQLAKSVADSVLVEDRFGAIPEAVAEGRQIISNVQRVAKLFVTKSVFAAFVIATFGLWTGEFPLLPRHLSLAATFTVGIPGFVLALAPGAEPVEQEGFIRRVLRFAVPAGIVTGAATLAAYLAVTEANGQSLEDGRTAAMTVFVAVGLYLLLVLDADRMQESRRYAGVVVALAATLGGAYLAVLGSKAARSFFDLTVPGPWELIVIVVVSVAAFWTLGRIGLSPYRRS